MSIPCFSNMPIYDCPRCARQYIDNNYSKYDRDYTDGVEGGFRFAPAAYSPYLCTCGNTLWWHELTPAFSGSEELLVGGLYEARTPSFSQYVKIAEESIGDRRKERCARINAWRKGNDARRLPLSRHHKLLKIERENLVRLNKLLDGDDRWEVLDKADIERSLGHFEDAINLMDSFRHLPENGDENARMEAIRFLAKQTSTLVVPIYDALLASGKSVERKPICV